MPTPVDPFKSENTPVVDPANGLEIIRPFHRSSLIMKGMDRFISEQLDQPNIHDILNVACGPGGWVLDVASKYPRIQAVGVDISPQLIEYGCMHARLRELNNAKFKVVSNLQVLDFPNDSFDFINAHLLFEFTPSVVWPRLIKECLRITRLGGVVSLTECEQTITNNLAFEKLNAMYISALQIARKSSSLNGRDVDFTSTLSRLLRSAGYQNIEKTVHAIDYSVETKSHADWYQDIALGLKLVQPFLIKMGVTTQEELDHLYQQVMAELLSDDFCVILSLITIWGEKSQSSLERLTLDKERVQASLLGDFNGTGFEKESDGQSGANALDSQKPRPNELDGKTWTRYSISIWSDIRKSQEEIDLGHPAIFPVVLVSRLIEIFTNRNSRIVLDPFAGVGSTIVAAQRLGKEGIGIELSPEFAEKARTRCEQKTLFDNGYGSGTIYTANAIDLLNYVTEESVDLVITSPPYWNILSEKRTADYKEIRDYGNEEADLAKIDDYQEFLFQLMIIFTQVYKAMRNGAYCCVVVMDIRKKDKFYPFHSDIANFMQKIGFIYDDIIIWDRRHEYNNMRPLGYPFVFRVNKAHEFILIFQKPKVNVSDKSFNM